MILCEPSYEEVNNTAKMATEVFFPKFMNFLKSCMYRMPISFTYFYLNDFTIYSILFKISLNKP